ncbi:hypothetical protein Pstr01_37020 [Pseudomonas straminea]|nr:hypothetical protein Pstr01_37020 [Pseudomonas straminea]
MKAAAAARRGVEVGVVIAGSRIRFYRQEKKHIPGGDRSHSGGALSDHAPDHMLSKASNFNTQV